MTLPLLFSNHCAVRAVAVLPQLPTCVATCHPAAVCTWMMIPLLQYYYCCDVPLLQYYHCCDVTIAVVLPLLFSAVRAVAVLPSPPTRAATRHPTAVCTWRVLATGSLTSSRTRTRTGLPAATTIPAPTAVSWVTRPVLEVIRHAYRRQLPRLSLR